MQEIKGNLWDLRSEGYFICITVNCTPDSRGIAIMGKGIALEAATKFPNLPKLLGETQIEVGGETSKSFFTERSKRPQVFQNYRLITLPTKVMWRDNSDISLIQNSCKYLIEIADKVNFIPFPIYLPRPGCSNGRLEWEEVKPAIENILDDRFVICDLVGD